MKTNSVYKIGNIYKINGKKSKLIDEDINGGKKFQVVDGDTSGMIFYRRINIETDEEYLKKIAFIAIAILWAFICFYCSGISIKFGSSKEKQKKEIVKKNSKEQSYLDDKTFVIDGNLDPSDPIEKDALNIVSGSDF